MRIPYKNIAFAAVFVACLLASGIDETNTIRISNETSATATMAQMGVTR